MAERKQTPDVLAELLSAELPPATSVAPPAPLEPTGPKTARPQPAREPKPRPQPVREPARELWEVEIVTCQEHRGWRPRFVNGAEIQNWLAAPVAHDYINLRGADGWELAATATLDRFYGVADGLQLYFKRPKT